MLNIGPQELLLILLVALLVVGPKRLPELSRTIGRGLREFRKAQDEVTKTIRLGLDDSEPAGSKQKPTSTAATTAKPTQQETTAAQPPPNDQPQQDEGADIARSLGRGLNQIRRARREIEQSFRVDLTGRPPRTSARSTPTRGTSPPAPTPSSPPSQETQGPSEPHPEQSAPASPPDPEGPVEPSEPA